ncbi:RloB family protein [Streptomyces sp. F63]|uniref:RloB family protein n=1 Tax=Streptomyces sp. F63 TaxID=2824887 RepID=UPI0027DC2610|nr:RloB family protein [Streptomyces sp. F63]
MSKGDRAQDKRNRRRRDRSGASHALRRPPASYGDKSNRVVYVACEGSRTEPDYISLLNKTYGRDKSFRLKYCHPGHGNGLDPVETVQQTLKEAGPEDEKWALFDRDADDNRDRKIPDAMRLAADRGVQVALSHPSFELWLLLHFQHWTSQEHGHDEKVKDRLRRHRDAKGFKDYDKASGDRGKGLNDERGNALLGRETTAVRNARKLVKACPSGRCSADRIGKIQPIPAKGGEKYAEWTERTGHAAGCDPLKRDPSTDVWRLLASLGLGTVVEGRG